MLIIIIVINMKMIFSMKILRVELGENERDIIPAAIDSCKPDNLDSPMSALLVEIILLLDVNPTLPIFAHKTFFLGREREVWVGIKKKKKKKKTGLEL